MRPARRSSHCRGGGDLDQRPAGCRARRAPGARRRLLAERAVDRAVEQRDDAVRARPSTRTCRKPAARKLGGTSSRAATSIPTRSAPSRRAREAERLQRRGVDPLGVVGDDQQRRRRPRPAPAGRKRPRRRRSGRPARRTSQARRAARRPAATAAPRASASTRCSSSCSPENGSSASYSTPDRRAAPGSPRRVRPPRRGSPTCRCRPRPSARARRRGRRGRRKQGVDLDQLRLPPDQHALSVLAPAAGVEQSAAMNEQPPSDAPADQFEVHLEAVESLVASYGTRERRRSRTCSRRRWSRRLWRALLKRRRSRRLTGSTWRRGGPPARTGPARAQRALRRRQRARGCGACTGPGAATASFDTRMSHIADGLARALTAARARDVRLRAASRLGSEAARIGPRQGISPTPATARRP